MFLVLAPVLLLHLSISSSSGEYRILVILSFCSISQMGPENFHGKFPSFHFFCIILIRYGAQSSLLKNLSLCDVLLNMFPSSGPLDSF